MYYLELPKELKIETQGREERPEKVLSIFQPNLFCTILVFYLLPYAGIQFLRIKILIKDKMTLLVLLMYTVDLFLIWKTN